jgi:hypothetical protein
MKNNILVNIENIEKKIERLEKIKNILNELDVITLDLLQPEYQDISQIVYDAIDKVENLIK